MINRDFFAVSIYLQLYSNNEVDVHLKSYHASTSDCNTSQNTISSTSLPKEARGIFTSSSDGLKTINDGACHCRFDMSSHSLTFTLPLNTLWESPELFSKVLNGLNGYIVDAYHKVSVVIPKNDSDNDSFIHQIKRMLGDILNEHDELNMFTYSGRQRCLFDKFFTQQHKSSLKIFIGGTCLLNKINSDEQWLK